MDCQIYTPTITPVMAVNSYSNSAGLIFSECSTIASYLSGSMSDVRLYNRTLSAGEAHSLYASTQRI